MSDQAFFSSDDFFTSRGSGSERLPPGMLYASVGVAVAVSSSAVLLLACCIIRRKHKTNKTVVNEGYSVAVDSVSVRQFERYHYAEYSIPDDSTWPRRAQHRLSVSDGEYDTLTRNFKRSLTNTGHVYSHVTISGNNTKRQSASNAESPYDVTPYSKMASAVVTVSQDDKAGDTYGHVTINPLHSVLND